MNTRRYRCKVFGSSPPKGASRKGDIVSYCVPRARLFSHRRDRTRCRPPYLSAVSLLRSHLKTPSCACLPVGRDGDERCVCRRQKKTKSDAETILNQVQRKVHDNRVWFSFFVIPNQVLNLLQDLTISGSWF